MKPGLGSSRTVDDRRAARVLTDPRSATFIHPFLGQERSASEAAAEAGCGITTMAYRVRVLLAAGLIVNTRTRRRGGRPIKYYRSTHRTFRIPLAVTQFTDHEDQARKVGARIYRRITDAYSRVLSHSGSATRVVTRDSQDRIYSTDVPPHRDRQQRPLVFEDRLVRLSTEQAERLCAVLDAALLQLDDVNDENAHASSDTYAVMVAAVPVLV